MRIRPLLLRVSASWRSATRAKVAATLLGLTAILVADATPNRPLANLRNWVVDAYERHWPSLRPASRTLVIDIDSNSIRHVGQWPRDQLARLVEIAASARVVGIDLLLTETDRLAGSDHDTDAILAANLRRVPGVLAAAADPAGASPPHPVPAATPVFEAGKHHRAALPPHHRSVSWPQATLADAARGTGLITVPPEADGIMRRMPTVAWVGSVLIPSFDVEVERLLASVIAIAAMLQFGRIGDKAYTLLCGSAVILLGGGSFGAFATAGLLLDATLPVATLLGTNLVVLAERIHQEVRMRRRTEGELTNALREAELRTEAEIARESLAIALDAAQMGMWDADLIGGTSRRSARHDQIFGYPGPPPEWGRETLLARVTAEDRDAVARSLDAAMKTGALYFQCRIRAKIARHSFDLTSPRNRKAAEMRSLWSALTAIVCGIGFSARAEEAPVGFVKALSGTATVMHPSLQLSGPTSTPSSRALSKLRRGSRLSISFIFRQGRQSSNPRSRGDLGAAIASAKGTPNVDISVVGHTDVTGADPYNLALSL